MEFPLSFLYSTLKYFITNTYLNMDIKHCSGIFYRQQNISYTFSKNDMASDVRRT